MRFKGFCYSTDVCDDNRFPFHTLFLIHFLTQIQYYISTNSIDLLTVRVLSRMNSRPLVSHAKPRLQKPCIQIN